MTEEEFSLLDIDDIVISNIDASRIRITAKHYEDQISFTGIVIESGVDGWASDSSPLREYAQVGMKRRMSHPEDYRPDLASTFPTQHGFETGYKTKEDNLPVEPPTGLTCVQTQRWLVGFDKGISLARKHRSEHILAKRNL